VRTVLLVAAEPREFDGLLAHCGGVEKPRWPVQWARTAVLNGHRLYMLANGAGPRRAAQAIGAARTAKAPDAIVSFGFCGALEPGLEVGDIFAGTSVRTSERCFPLEQPLTRKPFHSGVVVSVNRVAQTAEEKRGLRATGASVVEMEAAGVLEAARGWGPRIYCVRAVTDLADEDFGLDLNAALRHDGHFDTMQLFTSALRRPRVLVPELLRLRRRCRKASRSLGDFIADCQF
jgi:adenosylhomocysteine nucleosidase